MITSLFKRSMFSGNPPEVVMPTVPMRNQFYECRQVVSIRGENIELVSHGRSRAQARDRMIDKMLMTGVPIGEDYERIAEPEVCGA